MGKQVAALYAGAGGSDGRNLRMRQGGKLYYRVSGRVRLPGAFHGFRQSDAHLRYDVRFSSPADRKYGKDDRRQESRVHQENRCDVKNAYAGEDSDAAFPVCGCSRFADFRYADGACEDGGISVC